MKQSNTVVVEARSQRVKLLLLLAAFYLDVLLAALQYGVVTAWQSSAWLPTTFFSNLMAFSNSYDSFEARNKPMKHLPPPTGPHPGVSLTLSPLFRNALNCME